jgi:hypothetical protein
MFLKLNYLGLSFPSGHSRLAPPLCVSANDSLSEKEKMLIWEDAVEDNFSGSKVIDDGTGQIVEAGREIGLEILTKITTLSSVRRVDILSSFPL